MRRLSALFAVAWLAACSEDPAPMGTGPVDLGMPTVDVGVWNEDAAVDPDLGTPDSGVVDDDAGEPDASPEDAALDAGDPPDATPDAGPSDATPVDGTPGDGATPDGAADAGPGDGGGPDAAADGGGMDAAVDAGPPDSGILADADGDGIADIHEGNGLTDTDNDGIPDSMDPDSDGDGILDSVEAGDLDLNSPPIDTDNDGIPDFRDLDADGDGINDALELTGDPDGDNIPNYIDTDSDGDFILDRHEGALDPDGDMIPSYLDDDSDGDGLLDAVEAGDQNLASPPLDSDFDGIANFLDLDSDADFITDAVEGVADSDLDTIPDYIDIDSDNDSILDRFEAGDQVLTTPPVDTDGDSVPDFRDTDSDGDTITDLAEGLNDTNNDMVPDRLSTDSDGDGWTDAAEAGDASLLTPPIDTDLDGTPDYRDLDSDGDGLRDQVELGCPTGSDRLLVDSDADTFDDLAETAYGSDPCSNVSLIDDFYFVLPPNGPGANAPLTFTDTQIDKADFALNIDTTASMGGEIANLRSSLSSSIIPGVAAVIPDAAFAVSSFEDYPILPFGDAASNDLPFRLGTRVTTNPQTAQAAVNALTTRSGYDIPESGHEALYQMCTGTGATWTGGAVPAFNVNVNRVPGVADGTIGGVGFRSDALPVILHMTDAVSHRGRDYAGQGTSAPPVATVQQSISGIGARIVTIASGVLRPLPEDLCAGRYSTYFGEIAPQGDVDWFEITGAVAGDVVSADASRPGFLDPMIAIANSTGIIAQDDNSGGFEDALLNNVTLTGTGPYYFAVTAAGDANFDGAGGTSSGSYFVNIDVGGVARRPTPTVCRADDANSRTGATSIVPIAQSVPAANVATCATNCDATMGLRDPTFADFTYPYEFAQDTGAVIPPCAWSFFGGARPAGCAVNQCCTGRNGAGVAPDSTGNCPLAFEIDSTGAGLGTAAVAGVEALVKFSSFTITTQVRPDPVQLAGGLDTTCFIHGVTPQSATPPNTCAPTPVAADLMPPVGLDSWQNVVPGTVLDFQVDAINQVAGTMNPCVASTNAPQQFTAFIDVVADGVTVVSTRQVIIIVPPTSPNGSN